MARLRILLFLLWAGVSSSTVVDLYRRVIGGQPCRQNERLFHVLLLRTDGTQTRFCGGSLLNNLWILTAAHCRDPGWTMSAVIGVHPGPGQIQVQIREPPVIFIDAHGEHDLMLLKLSSPTPHTHYAQLPNCLNHPNVNDQVQIAGHASNIMQPNNTRIPGFTPVLQCGNMPVVNCTQLLEILAIYPSTRHYTNQHLFCAQSCTVDICLGDSGGGVVFNGMIYGVIAVTGNGCIACEQAAGFMDICHSDYLQWIQNTI